MAGQRKQASQAPAPQGLVSSDAQNMTRSADQNWDESSEEAVDDPELGSPEVEQRELVVSTEHHGQRADKVLAQGVSEFSRSYLQQLLADGAVTLNGKVLLKPSAKVAVGDLLRVEMRPTQQSMAFQPEAMDLQVVYEDDDLLVINKPAGLVVHPAPGNWTGTLLNGLLARDEKARQVPRAGIVHRLDKDTSGLMVVARNRSTMDALIKMIAARDVSRQYLAIAHKEWGARKRREVNAPIGRDPRNRLRMAVVDLNLHPGKQAQTDFDWLAGDASHTLVRCTLHTGRTHQIRVHMASLGHPLIADTLYGGHPEGGLERQALHAFRLAFEHPVSRKPLVLYAQPPQDMAAALDLWGLRYNPPESL
ncbi:RluA family pseudouridine synthase [Comamonas resistens]|uniref:Pseudouridine synthase n=1 Tax=Comamonas resistens TaxID=3046670 RepID=A0ABY8SNG3_9BURK|nr:RluA family pseudouridine synthase [Comamonas resistens]MDL5038548.1 RluA family pseudouridine synthase [Comamonas resistens]WHS64036.1 RluA family pseudouridine synthase [Comamonas resistens]